MRDQVIVDLQETYASIYASQEEVEQLDEAMSSYERNRKRAAQRAAARNEARARGQTGNVPRVGYVSPRRERETWTDEGGQERHHTGARMPKKEDQKESYDLFDSILEHLVAEGYADTNEAALVIMANMSEEWRQSIVEGEGSIDIDKLDKLRPKIGRMSPPELRARYGNAGVPTGSRLTSLVKGA